MGGQRAAAALCNPLQDIPMMQFTLRSLASALLAVLWLAGAAHAQTDPAPAPPAGENADSAERGQRLFNQYCYHCHGTNAVQGEKSQDLRRMKLRYSDDRATVFWQAVMVGRIDKGMPSWSGALDAEALQSIEAFLETVQK
jgi:mono/diheme cytochrome c family protein